MKISFHFLLFVLTASHAFSQTLEQRNELQRNQNDIAAAHIKIADRTARNEVTEFFIQRFGYIHQTNTQCLALVNKTESLAKQLSTPQLFSENFSSSQQAYSALEVLADLIMREDIILDEILKTQDELELQKKNLKSTEVFLSYGMNSVYARFPIPKDIENEPVYYKALWEEYQNFVLKYGESMKSYISRCVDIKLDFRNEIEKRKSIYKQFNKNLSDYYLEAFQQEYSRDIISKYQPSENTKVMLAIQTAFDELDRRYRDAVLIDSDYFKAISIIDSYENIATIILTRVVPRELDSAVRISAEKEVERRITAAKNYEKLINKQKPSHFLEKRFKKTQEKIKTGQLTCINMCKKNLDQVEMLISAARIVEDISTENIYSMLGYQALDLVHK